MDIDKDHRGPWCLDRCLDRWWFSIEYGISHHTTVDPKTLTDDGEAAL